MDRPSREEGKQTDAKMAINFTSGVGRKGTLLLQLQLITL